MVRDLHVQMLDRIDRVGADVFTARPSVPRWRTAEIVARRSLLRSAATPQ
jgi:phytoene/squalene synthetase